MIRNNIAVFRGLTHQVGLRRAVRITLFKRLRRVLGGHSQLHFSHTGEDLIIHFLVAKYLSANQITYVDVGCHHPQRISSSYLLYLQGSSGLVIDMNSIYRKAFLAERPRDAFVSAAVSDKADSATFFEFSAPEVNTIDPQQARQWAKQWRPIGSRDIETVTLDSRVRAHLPGRAVDILMIDVEGHELEVLRGANLAAMRPKIIVCEIHDFDITAPNKHPTTSYLSCFGFRLVAYATVNSYFVHEGMCI